MNIAIIFAGGNGVRMGSGIPKQFLEINGKPIIVHTLQLFEYHDQVDKIYIAILPDYISYMRGLVKNYHLDKVAGVVDGGDTAQDSIYRALKKAASENPDSSVVLIHDGVRPFVTYETISDNIGSVREHGSAITCTSSFETILISEQGLTADTLPLRQASYVAQAPQSFYLKDILEAHECVRKQPSGYENLIDSCTLMKSLGKEVHLVMGNRGNIKVTTPEDVYMFRALLNYQENEQAFGLGLTGKSRYLLSMAAREHEKRDV